MPSMGSQGTGSGGCVPHSLMVLAVGSACSAYSTSHHSIQRKTLSVWLFSLVNYLHKDIGCKQCQAKNKKKNIWTYGSENDLILNSQGEAKLSFREEEQKDRETWPGPNPTQASRSSSAVTCSTEICLTGDAPHGWALLPSGAEHTVCLQRTQTQLSMFSSWLFFSEKFESCTGFRCEMQNYFPRTESLAFIDPVATL